MPNCPQAIDMFYAVNLVGGIANMIHPLSAEKEIEFHNSRLHILHLSTADELTLLDSGNRLEKKITGAACVCLLYTSTTDSRQIIRGDIFIALKGENFDGNRYAAAALEQGAALAIIDNADYQIGRAHV